MKSQEGSKPAERLNGSEMLVRALAEEGVEYVFGYPGGSVLNIFDAIYKQDKFKHILVRHEQGAAHAADAYSRASNKVGVALVTSGPGATNAVTGIATAYADSIPMVIFTGQVNTLAIGQDAFQEVDIVGISRPCVKHNFLVKDVKDLAKTIKKAFYIAKTGRPGPVLIDIPKDVSAAICEYQYPENMELRSYKPLTKGHLGQIKKALQLILSAERPLIHIGGGIVSANASELLQRLAFELGIPVNSTLNSGFGYRHDPFENEATVFHRGVDISASDGTEVKSVLAGKVVEVGYNDIGGNFIRIDHSNGFITYYGHLQQSLVEEGDTVERAQIIAFSGHTGNVTGAHLHFQIEYGERFVDPEVYFKFNEE